MFMARYTYSKSLDDASTIGGGGQTVIQNNADPRGDYGLSSFDMRHQFLGNFSYQLPFGDRQRFAAQRLGESVFGAWRVNGEVYRAFRHSLYGKSLLEESGVPECSRRQLRARRPDPATPRWRTRRVQEWFNTAAFSIPTGVLRRCSAKFGHRPGRVHDQFGVSKTIQFGRDGLRRLDFSWNTTNLLNHVNYSRAVHGVGFHNVRPNYRGRRQCEA